MITDQDMERLAELAGKATSGPWGVSGRRGNNWGNSVGQPGKPPIFYAKNQNTVFNAAFIAAANPSTILSLIERVKEAERRASDAKHLAIVACSEVCLRLADDASAPKRGDFVRADAFITAATLIREELRK